MPEASDLFTSSAIQRALNRIAHEIAERNPNSHSTAIVGIQKGGIHLAARLSKLLAEIWSHPVPLGSLDVSMYRDDLGQRPAPQVMPTEISFDVTSKDIVLVDDVLFSGRTVRAALDALKDLGRPASIQLAVLIDRGQRQLPIQPDYWGKKISTSPATRFKVNWREDGGNDSVRLEPA